MAFDYDKAFALRDNPFNPRDDIEGATNETLTWDLANKPLLVRLEPALERLYSPDAGPFGTYLENFQRFARRNGYRDKPLPPKAGKIPFLCSIFGIEGTGKTTLSQVMVSWLKNCTPKRGPWKVYDEWSFEKNPDPARQIERIDAIQQKVQSEVSVGGHCCIIADNIVSSSVLNRAFQMYDDLTRDRVVFLFLLSNERELFPALSNQGKVNITPFRMLPLSASWAVSFVRRRVEEFRLKFGEHQPQPPWLEKYPLFPFDEGDIRSAFDKNEVVGLLPGYADTVSLRQFGGILNDILAERLEELNDDFDIMEVPEVDINQHLLKLSSAYRQLVETRKLVVNG